jgi:membrane protein HdeD
MKHWFLLLIAGLIAVAGGILALFNPIAATMTATTIVAWLFLIMGALQIVAAFGDMGTGSRIWTAALGALAIFIGGWILSNPIAGTLALTWTIGLLFFIEGVVKLVLAFATRGTPYFWALLLSGAISVLLGGMILARFPASALTIPGILLAVDLISTGVSMVALALHFKGRSQSA